MSAAWQAGRVSEAGQAQGQVSEAAPVSDVIALVPEWTNVPDVAEALGVPITRVHQFLNEGTMAGMRSGGVLRVPAGFVQDGAVLKGLPGVLNLLHDGGYDDEAALRWLHTPDDSLPGTPVDALRADRSREVKRRAQALAF